jgi:hypothetical protein
MAVEESQIVTTPPVIEDIEPINVAGRFESHEVFSPPPDEAAVIWRYLDFTKFVSLLDSRRLFFARVSTFDDAFEGSISAATQVARQRAVATYDLADQHREGFLEGLKRATRSAPQWTFANCWSLSEVESAAFWGLYVPPSGGVAIRSTYGNLARAFSLPSQSNSAERSVPILIGTVSYVDYNDTVIPTDNAFYPFLHKRKSYEFEKEIRAMTLDLESFVDGSSPVGLNVEVDLDVLINGVHISPTAPPWFAALVESIVERYGCAASVVQSSLNAEPLY